MDRAVEHDRIVRAVESGAMAGSSQLVSEVLWASETMTEAEQAGLLWLVEQTARVAREYRELIKGDGEDEGR